MGINYLKISCFLYILVGYSQALAGVENCKIVSVTHCDDCAPVKVKCGKKVGYVNNIRPNHIKVKVTYLSNSTEVTYQLDSPPDRILQYRDASAANQLNPWIRNEVSKRFDMNDVEFNESNLLIRIAEYGGFGLDGKITLYRNPQRKRGVTISSVPEVPFSNTCEYIAEPRLLFSYKYKNMCIGEVICHSSSGVYTRTAVCHTNSLKCPSAVDCYRDADVVATTSANSGLIRYYDTESGSVIDPGKNPGK